MVCQALALKAAWRLQHPWYWQQPVASMCSPAECLHVAVSLCSLYMARRLCSCDPCCLDAATCQNMQFGGVVWRCTRLCAAVPVFQTW